MGPTTDPTPSSSDAKLTGIPSTAPQEPTSVGTPGAVHVMGINHPEEGRTVDVSDRTDPPVVAHLAPDSVDIEALITEQVEDRVRQRDLCQAIVPIVSDDNIIVVVAAEKAVSNHASWKKQIIWISIILLLFVFGGAVYWLLGDNRKDNQMKRSQEPSQTEDPSVTATISPTSLDPLVEELRLWIAPTDTDLATLSDPTSPQSQALAWLKDDPITLAPGRSTRTVLERYALAVLYFTTSGPSWQHELLSDADICTWNKAGADIHNKTTRELLDVNMWGVYCAEDGESIDIMVLVENNIVGTLPWEFALLTNLKYVNIGWNALSGTIPTRISELERLEVFLGFDANFTGPVPSTFSPATWIVDLDRNMLTGTLPESWGTSMPALEVIFLSFNALTGTLPTTLGQLSKLYNFQIYNNLLTGTLPSELSELPSLSDMYIGANSFSGSVEESLCTSSREWNNLGADCAEVDCPCCTLCCFDNQTMCNEM